MPLKMTKEVLFTCAFWFDEGLVHSFLSICRRSTRDQTEHLNGEDTISSDTDREEEEDYAADDLDTDQESSIDSVGNESDSLFREANEGPYPEPCY